MNPCLKAHCLAPAPIVYHSEKKPQINGTLNQVHFVCFQHESRIAWSNETAYQIECNPQFHGIAHGVE